ncbi:hypothetical protein [Anaeromyxobacter dehalogenans]|uniref:Uncharacterized protein n=1 Tax=Anaeromyxobacter dehalogenans (strain 2CP-C) TaxID=290397 RepID=Q2ILA2_ANADE|nr:hypothetical protein [Anaeromyxobacter dehalogenans]ABC82431.1 hypothetical protein Adeh_2661 [Anaeromyxobacter dehalogenans 2CP-C]
MASDRPDHPSDESMVPKVQGLAGGPGPAPPGVDDGTPHPGAEPPGQAPEADAQRRAADAAERSAGTRKAHVDEARRAHPARGGRQAGEGETGETGEAGEPVHEPPAPRGAGEREGGGGTRR